MRPVACEVATVWAETGNQWEQRRSSVETRMTATEGDSGCGSGSKFQAPAEPGRKPWPSTLPAAPVGSGAGPLSGRLRRGLAGGPGKERLRPQGPGDCGRPPPMARGACSPCPPGKALETTRLKLASAPGTAVRRVENGSSSFRVPATKDTSVYFSNSSVAFG